MTPTEGRATFRNMMESIAALHATGRAHGHLSRGAFDGSGQLVSPTGQMLVRRGSEQDGGPKFRPQEVTGWCPFTVWQVEMSQVHASVQERLVYRAPEELVLGVADVLRCSHSPTSAQAVDMWAMGCILAELVNGGVSLFEQAETNFDLLSFHCDLFGFKYISNDLVVCSDKETAATADPATLTRASLRDLLVDFRLCHHGHDLVARLLSCEGSARPSARDALAHPFLSGQCSCPLDRSRSTCCAPEHPHCAVDSPPSQSDQEKLSSEVCVRTCSRAPSGDAQPRDPASYPSLLYASGIDGSCGARLPAELQELLQQRRRKRARCPVDGPRAEPGKRLKAAPSGPVHSIC